jgi:hypothetical protein
MDHQDLLLHYHQQLLQTAFQLDEELVTIRFSIRKQLPLLSSTYEQVCEDIATLTYLLASIKEEIDQRYLVQREHSLAADRQTCQEEIIT